MDSSLYLVVELDRFMFTARDVKVTKAYSIVEVVVVGLELVNFLVECQRFLVILKVEV